MATGFAVVQRFQLRQFVGVLFDQLGELPHHAGAIGSGRAAPRPVFKSLTGDGNGFVDIGRVAFGHLGDHPSGARIERVEGFAGYGVDPLAADKSLMLPGKKPGRGFAELRVGKGYIHSVFSTRIKSLCRSSAAGQNG